jgi:hypothetical protein
VLYEMLTGETAFDTEYVLLLIPVGGDRLANIVCHDYCSEDVEDWQTPLFRKIRRADYDK